MRLDHRALALLLAGLAIPAPALAVPVAIYPLDRRPGDEDAAVVQSLVEAAVHHAARRSDVRAADPLVVPGHCGPSATARRACLAVFAGRGLVLRAGVRRTEGIIVVALEAVDGAGQTFGPVGIGLEIVIQNTEPFTRAIVDLAARAERPTPAVARAPQRGAAPSGSLAVAAPSAPGPAAPPAAPEPAPAATSWQAAAAPWVTAGGLALAGVGGMYAASNQTLTSKLERKAASGTLTEADQRWYRTSEQYSTISRSLLIAGAAVTASGLFLWTIAPSVEPVQGGVQVGVSGRF